MTPREYAQQMSPYANRASQQTGIYPSIILLQWGLESGWGTSHFASYNNHGGITYVDESIAAGPIPAPGVAGQTFAAYASLWQFADDYARVMSLSYYAEVRAACQRGEERTEICRQLGLSPYDAGHYELHGVPGAKLMNVLEHAPELAEYDNQPPTGGGGAGRILLLALAGIVVLLSLLGQRHT